MTMTTMNELNKDIRELTINELDVVTGGNDPIGSVVKAPAVALERFIAQYQYLTPPYSEP